MGAVEKPPAGSDGQNTVEQDEIETPAGEPGWDDAFLSGASGSDDEERRFPSPTGMP
jgi:hypothetical protein